jgi:hypothetical protein
MGIEKHDGKAHDGVIQRQFPDEYAMEGIEEILTMSLTMCTMHTHRPRGASTQHEIPQLYVSREGMHSTPISAPTMDELALLLRAGENLMPMPLGREDPEY